MDPGQLLDRMRATATTLDRLEAPAASGVYAFFLAEGARVPGVAHPGSDALYVGLSGNLAQREFDTHFAAGKSGFSTLRRSLGALMRTSLALHPRPRGSGASATNYRNYRFDDAGEERLSGWMRDHLLVGVHALAEPAAIERALIALARPPLNLKGWSNPDATTVKAARKECAELARSAEPRGGARQSILAAGHDAS